MTEHVDYVCIGCGRRTGGCRCMGCGPGPKPRIAHGLCITCERLPARQTPPPPLKAETPMLEVTYQCSNPRCGALDLGRFYPGERPFPALMCGTCHAGTGMTLQQMVQHRVGMYPLLEPSVVH